MRLNQMKIGESRTILRVGGQGAIRRRLLEMGLTPGTEVLVRKTAPFGDPIELCLRGYELTVRADEAEKIEVSGRG